VGGGGLRKSIYKVLGPWKDAHDPTNHDDIIGPCEEFGMERPLGYDEAKPGETFLKVGVGELEKPKEEKYSFARKYKIVKPAWKPSDPRPRPGADPDWPALRWEMAGSLPSGYGYEYRKDILGFPGMARFAIYHTLKNTGTKAFTTDFYNHNFFNVDGDPVGPNYRLVFPFDPKAKDLRGRFGELVSLDGKELRFKDRLTNGFVMAGLTGFGPTDETSSFEMRHQPSGVTVRTAQSYPYSKLNVWGINTTICPEPFHQITLKPGEDHQWVVTYDFVLDPPKK
jgi:hypothetical protein